MVLCVQASLNGLRLATQSHLIVESLSNGEIFKRQVMNEKTVKNHVGNILSTLHLGEIVHKRLFYLA
jgi:hypothetical protein